MFLPKLNYKMPITHLLLALLVVVIWGLNFIFVKFGLEEISPLALCAFRFILASVPALFFIKPPKVSLKYLVLYGLFMFAFQFGFVFVGMNVGMTPGMASLIMQIQIFFSMFFAMIFLGEKPSIGHIVGALVSFSGIGLVAFHFDSNVSVWGFICILLAAVSWGVGNLVAKKMNSANLVGVVVWGSFIASWPMMLMALLFEGKDQVMASIENVSWLGIGSLLYIVYASTWIGYGVWSWLLGKYPVSAIVPFTLLVPVVGILSSVLILDEPFQLWKLVSCLLVISGLCINLITTRFSMAKVEVPAQ